MNNRFQELAEEAGYQKDGFGIGHWDMPEFKKYTELLIQECMRMCEVTEMSFVTHGCDVEASGAITVKQFIAEHFGVED